MNGRRAFLPDEGFTMIEVLVTLVILAFGILGLANLQGKMHLGSMEGYQRSQANLLMQDMVNRIYANSDNAALYVTGPSSPLGVGDAQSAPCPATPIQARDFCEWSMALKGAAEVDDSNNVGAMLGARGCVELIQAVNVVTCTPGSYRVSIVWQGLHETAAPEAGLACAAGSYGGEKYRRIISTPVTIGLPTC